MEILEKLEKIQKQLAKPVETTADEVRELLKSLKGVVPALTKKNPGFGPALRDLRDQIESIPQATGEVADKIKSAVRQKLEQLAEKLKDSPSEPATRTPAQKDTAADKKEPPAPAPPPPLPPPRDPSSAVDKEAPQNLDDLSLLLIQMEPSDSSALSLFRDRLRGFLAKQSSLPANVRERLTSMEPLLEELLQGKCRQPEDAFRRIGTILETAADMKEDDTKIKDPKPEAAPVPPIVETAPPKEEKAMPQEFLLPADCDKDLLEEFINESKEYVSNSEASLLNLETNLEDVESINVIFRAFHTIKGTSAFLGLTLITELAHKAETLLSRMRDKEIQCSGGYADLALRSSDMIKDLLNRTQEGLSGKPICKPGSYDELLVILANPEAYGVSTRSEAATEVPRIGDILVAQGKIERETVEIMAQQEPEKPIGVKLVENQAVPVTDVAHAIRTQQRMAAASEAPTTTSHTTESSVRVRTDRLDKLIDTVGELVIAQSMVAQGSRALSGDLLDLARKIGHAGKIVREMQDLSMSMRMVPLKPTFQKLTRLVRDLAHKSGKQVQFITEGEETEIDRNMVDYVSDPLVHMVRNSLDHGLESPEDREKHHKPKLGTVRLSAYHSGGNVVLELQDDGWGLNREKILKKAISNGLVESDKGMSDNDIYNLIFAPGFSTAEKVTDVSGRGVGMDVVRRNIEALRGHIEISTELLKGTTFTIRLPLTLAITDGMLVKIGNERFIVPTVNIHMSLRPEAKSIATVTGRGEMILLRGDLIPIYRIHRLFDVPGAVEELTGALLMIVDDGDKRSALMVDELQGQQQVVAKPLGEGIGKIQGISGGAILSDGRVGLIIDPMEVATLARQKGGLMI